MGAANVLRNLPGKRPRLIGNAAHGEVGEAAEQVKQGAVAGVGAARQLAIEAQRDVPATVQREVSRQDEKPQQGRIPGPGRPIPQGPHLRVKSAAARRGDLDDDPFEQ